MTNQLIEALANLVDNAIPWHLFLDYPRPPADAVDAPEDQDLDWQEIRRAT